MATGPLDTVRGRHADALADHEAAERLAEMLVTPHNRATWSRSHMLQTLVRLGQTERVEDALGRMDSRERATPEMRTTLASLRLAKDDPRAATTALASVIDGSIPGVPALWMVTALLLDAVARDALRDTQTAGRALESALDAAEPHRMLIPFLIHPAPGLLERHARQRTAHAALLADVLSLLSGSGPIRIAPPAATPIAAAGRIEPLSQAETRVLRYLPTPLTVAEIAGQLAERGPPHLGRLRP